VERRSRRIDGMREEGQLLEGSRRLWVSIRQVRSLRLDCEQAINEAQSEERVLGLLARQSLLCLFQLCLYVCLLPREGSTTTLRTERHTDNKIVVNTLAFQSWLTNLCPYTLTRM
jgi:hypothetical protein